MAVTRDRNGNITSGTPRPAPARPSGVVSQPPNAMNGQTGPQAQIAQQASQVKYRPDVGAGMNDAQYAGRQQESGRVQSGQSGASNGYTSTGQGGPVAGLKAVAAQGVSQAASNPQQEAFERAQALNLEQTRYSQQQAIAEQERQQQTQRDIQARSDAEATQRRTEQQQTQFKAQDNMNLEEARRTAAFQASEERSAANARQQSAQQAQQSQLQFGNTAAQEQTRLGATLQSEQDARRATLSQTDFQNRWNMINSLPPIDGPSSAQVSGIPQGMGAPEMPVGAPTPGGMPGNSDMMRTTGGGTTNSTMSGPQAQVNASNLPPEETAARNAAFGRAKDRQGQTARSSIDALRGVMSETGNLGGGQEAAGIGAIVGGAAGGMGEFERDQLMSDQSRIGQVADRTYAGNLQKRQQDIGYRQSLIGLMGSGRSLY